MKNRMPKTCLWRACGDKRNHQYFRIVIMHNTTVFIGTHMIGDAASKSEKWSNWPWKFRNGRVQYWFDSFPRHVLVICHQGLVATWHFSHHGGRAKHPAFCSTSPQQPGKLWRHGISQKMHSPQNIGVANVSARHHKITLFAKIFVIVVALSNQGVGRFWVPVIYWERFARSCWWHVCARCLDFGMYIYI